MPEKEVPSLEEVLKPFRMVVIYDSADASNEAAFAAELVLRELGDEIAVDKTFWESSDLDNASLRARAAEEAAVADLILVALSEGTASSPIREWINQWQKKRTLSGGLLALIPCGKTADAEAGSDLSELLYETAVSADMDFICRRKRRF
jgi:hypothetical protein